MEYYLVIKNDHYTVIIHCNKKNVSPKDYAQKLNKNSKFNMITTT